MQPLVKLIEQFFQKNETYFAKMWKSIFKVGKIFGCRKNWWDFAIIFKSLKSFISMLRLPITNIKGWMALFPFTTSLHLWWKSWLFNHIVCKRCLPRNSNYSLNYLAKVKIKFNIYLVFINEHADGYLGSLNWWQTYAQGTCTGCLKNNATL